MAATVQSVLGRSSQNDVEQMQTEYFTWVNAQLGAGIGIGIAVETMTTRDLAELEVNLPPGEALYLAVDGDDLAGDDLLGSDSGRHRPGAADVGAPGLSLTRAGWHAVDTRCSPDSCSPRARPSKSLTPRAGSSSRHAPADSAVTRSPLLRSAWHAWRDACRTTGDARQRKQR